MRLMRWLTALIFGGVLAAGCAALPMLHRQVPKPTGSEAPPEDGYNDYRGVIHIHTRDSHDSVGRFEDVIAAAQAQALDYLIITEHNNLKPLEDGKGGWHGATLVLIGEEISTRDGHYLALNVTKHTDRRLPTQTIIDRVNAQGGLGFVAHPFLRKCPWRYWHAPGITGLEIYNATHNMLEDNLLRLLAASALMPPEQFFESLLERPEEPLAQWDRLTQSARWVGIGSADAHEFQLGGFTLGGLLPAPMPRVVIAPYAMMFKLVRTHLLAHTLSPEALYDALRQGHAYVAFDLLTDATGFTFAAQDRTGLVGVMGDEVPLSQGLQLIAWLPQAATIRLIKDGQPILTVTGQRCAQAVTAAGVYRIEAMLRHRPWILSNPIYVRAAAASVASQTLPSQPALGVPSTAREPLNVQSAPVRP